VHARRLAFVLLVPALAGSREASATPPLPDPVDVRFSRDVDAVDLTECHGMARKQHRFFFVLVTGAYELKRRPRFQVRARYGAPVAVVDCVQDRFARYQKGAPEHDTDAYAAPRLPRFTAHRWLTLGEPRDILPASPRVLAVLRAAVPTGGGHRLGPGITLASGRCLLTDLSDLVGHGFVAWREASFPQRLPSEEEDLAEGERFRVDDSWLLDVRAGIDEGFVACLVPTGKLEHHLTEVREQLDTWGLLDDDLDRRPLFVTWTVGRSHHAHHIDSCVGARAARQRPAPAAAVAKLRGELAKLLADQPLPAGRPGESFMATLGPWHGLSLRRLSGPPAFPSGCQR
jgi:hypothetical protein